MRKLLLADDSVTIQRVIELTFSGEDIQVVAVNDGEQAIARIPAERPDVVLADIGMPRKGGYDVAAFVKGRPDLSHIPVLLLAGAFEPVDQTRAEQVGADGVLIKPFEPRQVVERVKELLAAVRPTISGEVVAERAAPVAVPPAPVTMAPPVEGHGAPQVQSLDELFESLNQALGGRSAAPEPAPPSLDAVVAGPATSWPADREWMIPTASDEPHAANGHGDSVVDRGPVDEVFFDSAPFDAVAGPSASAATLDDYFDRLSAAFSHTRPASPSDEALHHIEDFDRVAAPGPPPASHEWLGQAGKPHPQAFESGEGHGNPILGAVSTLMARSQPSPEAGWSAHAGPAVNGTSAQPVPDAGATAPSDRYADLVDIVTERVLARLVPELTESLRRLVREEIDRSQQY